MHRCIVLVGWSEKNVPHRLRYLSTVLPVGGAVWGISADLLEVEYHWEWALRVHSLTPLPVSWPLLYDCGQKSDPSASCPCLHACHVSLLWCHLESRAKINSIFFQQVSLDHVVSSQQPRGGDTLRKTKLNSTQGKLEGKEMCSFMAYGLHGVWSQQCQHLMFLSLQRQCSLTHSWTL